MDFVDTDGEESNEDDNYEDATMLHLVEHSWS